ncbi:MAG: hypothetical protein Q9227_008764 [Pyrenula ochraceoflavens]
MLSKGITKTYKLTYESAEVQRANFDLSASPNHWTIQSRTVRDITEYFGPKTEQLDWFYENDKVVFTSYTEKVSDGRRKCWYFRNCSILLKIPEILKQPLHTSVAIERKDFDAFSVQERLHIGIVVRDFKAIVTHADSLHVDMTTRYSHGSRPMQISYGSGGLACEYILMTRGHSTDTTARSATAQTRTRDLSVRPSSRPDETRDGSRYQSRESSAMPPPKTVRKDPAPNRPLESRPAAPITTPASAPKPASPPPAPSASLNPDSMFVPAGDDERQWDAPDYNEEDDGEQLFWDQTPNFVSIRTA